MFENKDKTTLIRVNNKSVIGIAFTFYIILDKHPEVLLFYVFGGGGALEVGGKIT